MLWGISRHFVKCTTEPNVYFMGKVQRNNTQPALENSGSERRDLGSPVGHAWNYFHQAPSMMSPDIRGWTPATESQKVDLEACKNGFISERSAHINLIAWIHLSDQCSCQANRLDCKGGSWCALTVGRLHWQRNVNISRTIRTPSYSNIANVRGNYSRHFFWVDYLHEKFRYHSSYLMSLKLTIRWVNVSEVLQVRKTKLIFPAWEEPLQGGHFVVFSLANSLSRAVHE